MREENPRISKRIRKTIKSKCAMRFSIMKEFERQSNLKVVLNLL